MPSDATRAKLLRKIYRILLQALGPQHWWPARSSFEIMVGAILTQSTSWHNVERTIARLRAANALSAKQLARLKTRTIERLIQSSGYFRQKTNRLQSYSRWYLAKYGASARRMFRQGEHGSLREELLALSGIGPETADAILLYAGNQPVFVVDAYTRRIFRRHRLSYSDEPYDQLQQWVMDRLPSDPRVYNELHALLVAVGKRYCHRRNPDCKHCPLGALPRTLEVNEHG